MRVLGARGPSGNLLVWGGDLNLSFPPQIGNLTGSFTNFRSPKYPELLDELVRSLSSKHLALVDTFLADMNSAGSDILDPITWLNSQGQESQLDYIAGPVRLTSNFKVWKPRIRLPRAAKNLGHCMPIATFDCEEPVVNMVRGPLPNTS